jgi:sec-independent protein translocase protein TatA
MNVFGVGPTEIFIVLIVILVLFGPDRLPELAKKIGGASKEIRDNLNTVNEQMNTALEGSMEADKARMIKPGETKPAGTPSNIEFFPTEQPPGKVEPVSENQILPETTEDVTPAPPPLDK